jgi:hypothetical protein
MLRKATLGCSIGFFSVMVVGSAAAADLPKGQIIDSVECEADSSQRYALYVPSNYTPDRKWSVIFAFDAGARGRVAVERYQLAAEKYGYIVAGSLNSRNGPWEPSLVSAKAMSSDVVKRFSIDPKRVYTAGMSGGSRLAMMLAINSTSPVPHVIAGGTVAGVFASSAGFPDEFMKTVPFAVFGSAGKDDFNHMEMHELDRDLASAHRILYFDGGHTWLPAELAIQGVEWMELQAIKFGLRVKDQALIDKLFAARADEVAQAKGSFETLQALNHLVEDFKGLKDVSKYEARAAALAKQQDVKDSMLADRKAEERELQVQAEIYQFRDRRSSTVSFGKLKERVTQLAEQSKAAEDSTDRRIARRVLTGFAASSRGARDPQMQELLEIIRPQGGPGRP